MRVRSCMLSRCSRSGSERTGINSSFPSKVSCFLAAYGVNELT